MKTLGFLYFVTNTLPHKSKFDPRGLKCILLGYLTGQKAYKVYDVKTHKVYVNKDVVFNENIVPYTENSTKSSAIDMPFADQINDLLVFFLTDYKHLYTYINMIMITLVSYLISLTKIAKQIKYQVLHSYTIFSESRDAFSSHTSLESSISYQISTSYIHQIIHQTIFQPLQTHVIPL